MWRGFGRFVRVSDRFSTTAAGEFMAAGSRIHAKLVFRPLRPLANHLLAFLFLSSITFTAMSKRSAVEDGTKLSADPEQAVFRANQEDQSQHMLTNFTEKRMAVKVIWVGESRKFG